MGEVGGAGNIHYAGMTRVKAVQEHVGKALGKYGTVSRGVLTALYDQRFGPYELAKEVYKPTRTWPANDPPGIQTFHYELASNSMHHRIDVIAEALFAGADFNVFGPLFLARSWGDGKTHEDGSIVKINLAHPAKQLRGMLVLDSSLEGGSPLASHNFLVVQKTPNMEILHLTTWSLAKLGLFAVDSMDFYMDAIIHRDRSENPPFKRPIADYQTVQAALADLCERLGIRARID